MGARIGIPLWVSLPCVAVSVAGLGAVAAGAVGVSVARGYLTGQVDSSLVACAGEAAGQGVAGWPVPVRSGGCDAELLSAGGRLVAPAAPGEGAGPVIPAGRWWLAAHVSRPVTVPGVGVAWRVLLEAVRYQPQRVLYVYGPDDVRYVIGGRAGRGASGFLVVMAGMAGVGRFAALAAARWAAAAGAVLVLLAVAVLAVTRAVLRPLRQAAWSGPFAAASVRVSRRMAASRAAEAAAGRSVAEMTERLSEVSRELRTSVSIVRGSAESCRRPGRPRPAAGDPVMRRVAGEVTRMEALVAQLDADPLHPPPGRTAPTPDDSTRPAS